jgi:hypothetical protein
MPSLLTQRGNSIPSAQLASKTLIYDMKLALLAGAKLLNVRMGLFVDKV